MPTTREVEAARVERMRRQAEATAAAAPSPKSATGRRLARIEAAHRAATSPNRWRCKVEGCPQFDEWQPTGSREESLEAAHRHYLERHYRAPA